MKIIRDTLKGLFMMSLIGITITGLLSVLFLPIIISIATNNPIWLCMYVIFGAWVLGSKL